MEFDLINNPFFHIFKIDEAGIISEEIEDPSKFTSLYKYILDISNKKNKNQIINTINIFTDILKRQRSVSAYLPKYNNKSIYIFLFELFLKEKSNPQIRKALIDLISEININIQISKEDYDYIFQRFSKLYRKDKKFLESIKKQNYTFNDYFASLFELLQSTFSQIKNDKINPTNYYACFGINSFNLNFNQNDITIGTCLSFILCFRITKSKLMEKKPKTFNKCNLITIHFKDNKKLLNIELKYPNILNIIDGKQEIKLKNCPTDDWINLILSLTENNGSINMYFCVNEESMKIPIKLKNIKISKEEAINSITFFENFYGEVTSITILSQKHNDALNIFNKNLKIFTEIKKGLWDKKHIFKFMKNMQSLNYPEKKKDKGGGSTFFDDLVAVFTPINYDSSHPNIIEDCLGKYFLEINGNIRNHKYNQYQKSIYKICSVNNFLPIAEMFLIHQKEILNENNILEYFKLIAKIICGKDNLVEMNKSKFFKILGLILEKIPNEFFKENILNEFETIGINILEQNIKDFKSDFFQEILLNEKIINKYDTELKCYFWNKFVQIYITKKEITTYYINIEQFCNFLLYYDELAHKEMCCEFHLNMFKKDFIGNMTFMKPDLNYQLLSLKMLLTTHLISQKIESYNFLIDLLILDLSPCMVKFIIGIILQSLNSKSKEETSKKNLALGLINNESITIFINLFIHSLPDVRYEIFILMSSLYLYLLKINNLEGFVTFVKMIKTCLLPKNIFYSDKISNNPTQKTNKADNRKESIENVNIKKENIKQNEKNINRKKIEPVIHKKDTNVNNSIKNIDKNNNNVNNDKNNDKVNNKNNGKTINKTNNKDNNNKEQKTNQPGETKTHEPKRTSVKAKSILSIAEKFESKNKDKDKKVIKSNTVINPSKISDSKLKNFETKIANTKNQVQQNNSITITKTETEKVEKTEKTRKISNKNIEKNNNTNNNIDTQSLKEDNNKNNISQLNQELSTLKYKNSLKNLIIKNEIFDLYIYNIYNLLLNWILGVPIPYTTSLSTELFTCQNQGKNKEKKDNNLMIHINIFEIIFALNIDLDDINFTSRLLNDLYQLILLPENSYMFILNGKIYSSLLDITFKYVSYPKKNSKEYDIYKLGKNICTSIFINSLKYLKKQHKELPMNKLETIFLWGNIIVNKSTNEEMIYDFIHELLYDLVIKFKTESKEIYSFFELSFQNESEISKSFYFKNYLVVLTFAYNFCIHYKIDRVLKNNNSQSFLTSALNINIPDIFISGMRMDDTKGNNVSVNEYWKDFPLMEIILNDFEYIFKYSYIKNKIYKRKSVMKPKKTEQKEEKNLNYLKYTQILNDLIFNISQRNTFSKELYLLCFFESVEKNRFLSVPLIKMISITYICILSIIKNMENKQQFILYLNKYKNMLRFLCLASVNLNKNKKEPQIFDLIQNCCFEVVSSGLCFLNNLYETCSFNFRPEIKNVLNNIFLLSFSIQRIFLNKKLFTYLAEIYSYQNAITILFNEYIKDQNKNPFFNMNKLEQIYLNPSNQICELINQEEFLEVFFLNKNLKNKLYQNYYSINDYKNLVDERFKALASFDDKLDYSYYDGIYDLFTEFEKWFLKIYNKQCKNYVKNRKEYKRQKKKIFTFNRMWSNRELFYGNNENDIIKYKVINHYSKNLMRPLISPIFDINYYLPKFTHFNVENMFMKNNSKENISKSSFDLILDFERIIKLSLPQNDKKKNDTQTEPKKSPNKYILREQYYKMEQIYHEFLKNISILINDKLKEEEIDIKENSEEAKYNSEDFLKINSLESQLRKKDNTLSTRISTIKVLDRQKPLDLSYDKKMVKDNDNEFIKCCLVKTTHHIKGLLYIKDKRISFKTFFGKKIEKEIELELYQKDDNYDIERDDCYGSYFKKYEKDKNLFKIRIRFNDIKLILKRKYYYKNSAIEIFTNKNKSYFFNFNCENMRKIFLDELLKKLGDISLIIDDMKDSNNKDNKENAIGFLNNRYISILNKNESKKNTIKISKLIKLWKSWEISNFEFLMYLNILSNRSYNDISQYPVFPWLLKNYEDPLFKKSENDYLYRDLSVPMGMLNINEESIQRSLNYSSTFKVIKEDVTVNKPYFYGCNYSNPTYICNYLIRLFPYSQACIEIQGNGFDTPRRLFASIAKAFKNASTQSTDIREIIPEFFYLPEMFLNLNKFNLSNEQTIVDDCITPCGNNPYKFTMTMKNILESQNVSNALNGWVDLIFGIKAKDDEAELAKNVFTENAYQEDINIEEIEDKISIIRYIEFGLIPNQLITIKEMDKKDKYEDVNKIKQITDSNYNLKYFKNKKASSTGQLNDISLIAIKNISNDKYVFLYNNNLAIEKKVWCSNKDCGEEIISKKQMLSSANRIRFNSIPCIKDCKNVKIIKDGKLIIIGGFYDGKINIYQNYSDTNYLTIYPFKDETLITTINTDSEEKFLFIGNDIGNISVMFISYSNINDWKEVIFLNDHLNLISSIESNYQLNVWASASIDGYINLYTLPSCKLVNSFKLETTNSCNNIFICDSPLPSIILICQEEVFFYSINGHKIYIQKESSEIINPILIKNFIKNDYLAYIMKGKKICIRNVSDFSLISSIEIDREIFYLFTNENNKVLYATNINGTEINAVFCDNKNT